MQATHPLSGSPPVLGDSVKRQLLLHEGYIECSGNPYALGQMSCYPFTKARLATALFLLETTSTRPVGES